MNAIKGIYSQYSGLSRSAYVIFIARIVTNMGGFIWPLLTLILSRKLGYSATTIGIISLMIGVIFIPANIIGGKLADRFDKRKLIVIFDVISVSFFIACAFIEPSNLMTVFFVIAGLFATMEGPAFDALVADVSKPAEREKVYSLTYLGHNLGFVFGAAIGGFLFENHLPLAFLIDAATTLASTILIVLFVTAIKREELDDDERNEYEDDAAEQISGWKVLKDRKPVIVQILAFSMAALIYDQWAFVLPLYMEDLFLENGGKLFGFVASFNGFIVIVMTPVLVKLLDKYSEIPKTIIGVALFSGSYLLLKNTTYYPMFIVMMSIFTLGEIANMIGSSPYISRRVPATHLGRISSYRFIGAFIGGNIGRVILGVIIDNYSYAMAFNFLGGIGVLTIIILTLNYRYDRRSYPKLY
jgi:MFS family permease